MSIDTRCTRCHEALYTGQLHQTTEDCLENALDKLRSLRDALSEHERAMSIVLYATESCAASPGPAVAAGMHETQPYR
jgi:hypothetical protein